MKRLIYFLGTTIIAIILPAFAMYAQLPPAETEEEQTPKRKLTDSNIFGHVIDAETGEHLPYAFIFLSDLDKHTQSDSTGHYMLTNLPEGRHKVKVSVMGYLVHQGFIYAERGKTIEYNFALSKGENQIEEIVVTGNRYYTKKRETGQIVNVTSPKLFASTMAVNPAGVLDFQPGSRVEFNCTNCGLPSLRINGLGGEYTQILLDSRPIFSPLSMVYGLEQLPSSMIERVETVRGGGSALFGSNAIAGTVNIITKEPTGSMVQVKNLTGIVGGKGMDVNTSMNASMVSNDRRSGAYIFSMVRHRDAYDRNGDGYSEMPKLKSQTVGIRAYHKLSQKAKLTAEYHHIHEFRRGGDSLDFAPHHTTLCEQLEHYINGGGISFDFDANRNNNFNIYSSAQHIKRASYFGTDHNLDAYGKTMDITVNAGAQYLHRFDRLLFMPAVFTVGGDFFWNNLEDNIQAYDRDLRQKISQTGLYIQNEWTNNKLGILLGARLDKHSLLSSPVFSPRVTLRYAPDANWTFRAGFAQGYRAPQTYDEDLHVGAVGGEVSLISIAEGLKPEFSNSVTVSVNWWKKFGLWQLDLLAEGFYTNLKDVFTLENKGHDAQGNLLLERNNSDGAYVGGMNAEMRISHMQNFSLQGGFTVQRSRYLTDYSWSESVAPQRRMFRTPDLYGYFNLDYLPFKYLSVALSGKYTGPMLLMHYSGYIEKDTQVVSPSFMDLSLRLACPLHISNSLSAELFVSCKNILDSYQKDIDFGKDKDSQYIYGPAMPRTFYVGVNFDF
jgi:outer membrane receptor for ferrienterochelin and colicins